MDRFNNNQTGEVFKGFIDNIMNDIGGESGGRRREVEEGKVDIGVLLRRDQVYAWIIVMRFFP